MTEGGHSDRETFRAALRAYLVAAAAVIRAAVATSPDSLSVEPMLTWATEPGQPWGSSSQTVFVRRGHNITWSSEVGHVLAALPQRAELLRELSENPGTREQVNQLVGTRRGGSALQPETLLFEGVRAILKPNKDLDFDEALFASFAADVERRFFDTVRTETVLVPLSGLRSEGQGVEFGNGLALGRLHDDEILRLLELGLVNSHPIGPLAGFFVNVPPLWGLRFTWLEQKRIGQQSPSPTDLDELPGAAATTSTMRAVTALRLVHAGSLMPLAHLQFTEFSHGTAYSTFASLPYRVRPYVLGPADAADLVRIWKELGDDGVMRHGSIQNALRRFDFAHERSRPEDSLVDLMIAAESLFLSDLDRREGELRYRMSLRAAWLLGTDRPSRLEVFKRIRRAYDVRSDVVHGNAISRSALLKEFPDGMRGFVSAIEDLLRRALREMLTVVTTTGRPWASSDWDNLVMSDGHRGLDIPRVSPS